MINWWFVIPVISVSLLVIALCQLFGRRPAARLTIQFGLPKNGEYSMSLIINSDSPGVAATLNVSDKEGVTAKVFGVPVWSSDDEKVATVTPAADGMSAVVKPVAPGNCNIDVTLEGDETPGKDTITAVAPVEVVEPEATQASISFGEPQ